MSSIRAALPLVPFFLPTLDVSNTGKERLQSVSPLDSKSYSAVLALFYPAVKCMYSVKHLVLQGCFLILEKIRLCHHKLNLRL